MNCPLKIGDRVKFKDGDPATYKVYGIYNSKKVSLGLRDFPDTEMDYTTDISELIRVTKNNTGE